MENDPINQHYATLLGLGDEWKVTKVDLNVLGKKLDIFLEYAAEAAICPVCGKLGSVYDLTASGYAWASRRAIQTHQSKPVPDEWDGRSYAHSAKRECAEAKRRARARATRIGVSQAARDGFSTPKSQMKAKFLCQDFLCSHPILMLGQKSGKVGAT